MIIGYYYQPNGPYGLPPTPMPYYGLRKNKELKTLQILVDYLNTGRVWINIEENWLKPTR